MTENKTIQDALITVTLFGKFDLTNSQGTLDITTIASDKITALLSYLLHHHNRPITTQELYEVLWPDLACKNPAGALKNLIYRTRSLLRKYLGNYNYILTSRSTYIWNQNIPLLVDSETFEQAIITAEHTRNPQQRIALLDSAISLYNGKFLLHLPYDYWATTLSTYYHSLFLKCCKMLANCYDSSKNYREMIEFCKHVLSKDSLDEHMHFHLMKAYMKQHQTALAIEHYEHATQNLRCSLGVSSIPFLDNLYQEIISIHTMEQTTLEEVAIQLQEEQPSGAFLCDFGVFKDIYRIEARRVHRLGTIEHIALFTLEPGSRAFSDVSLQNNFIKKASTRLESYLQKHLRLGDVITKLSDTQYAILLPACSYEESNRIARNIQHAFYTEYRFERVKITYHLDELSMRAPYL